MTAQVALLNKSAVALASDSAVTISSSGGEKENDKIYNTVNKLFTLSKYEPIGIMVSGNAQFMGVPWESLIKIFRDNLGEKPYNYVEEYAERFIDFLGNSVHLKDLIQQKNYLHNNVGGYFILLKEDLDKKVKEIIEQEKKISNERTSSILDSILKEHLKILEGKEDLRVSDKVAFRKAYLSKFKNELNDIRKRIFGEADFTNAQITLFDKIAFNLFTKDKFSTEYSGVVVAGFGRKEIYPCLYGYIIEGRLLKKIKFKKDKITEINKSRTASIIPLGQAEMLHNFISGVHPAYQVEVIDNYVYKILTTYPRIIIEELIKKGIKQISNYEKALIKIGIDLYDEFEKNVKRYRKDQFIDPIMAILEFLPKDELAAMAESLINLASFRNRVSMELETVGGPIDVAVISKGDGFIWIKRKHYFKNEFNQHFTRNYFRLKNRRYQK